MPPARGPNFRRFLRYALLVALVGVVVWRGAVHATAWSHFNDARAALDRDDPAAARQHLDRCLEVWPRSAEGHFLAAQAARRTGDLVAARQHLGESAQLGWAPAALKVEDALLSARDGKLADVLDVLLAAVHQGHPDTAEALAILTPAYLAEFRLVEAAAFAERWVELRPGDAHAWACQADIQERMRKKEDAVNSLRRAAELDPSNKVTRLNLARMLLEPRKGTEEAAEHLEWLIKADPGNPAVAAQLAVCREVQGRLDEAVVLLDKALAAHPQDATLLHLRGKIELNRDRPEAALAFLRRATNASPADGAMLYSLFQCLQRVGTPAEVQEVQERMKRSETDLKRVAELGKAIGGSPDDPNLRREMGELFLRNGRDRDGLRWLDSALRIDPNHAATHQVLADYYVRTSRPDLAARHRLNAKRGP